MIKLSDLVDGQEAVCFAALVKKTRGMTKANHPYLKCLFRDKRTTRRSRLCGTTTASSRKPTPGPREPPIACTSAASSDLRYGMQIEILGDSPATEDDAADGFDFFDLVPEQPVSARRAAQEARRLDRSLHRPSGPQDAWSRTSSTRTWSLFQPDAGRSELPPFVHVRAARARLEHDADRRLPRRPLRQVLRPARSRRSIAGLIVAAAILHDIGKLRELEYHPSRPSTRRKAA